MITGADNILVHEVASVEEWVAINSVMMLILREVQSTEKDRKKGLSTVKIETTLIMSRKW